MKEACKHCGNSVFCQCKSKKHIAKVVYRFHGETKEEADKKLNAFYTKVKRMDLSFSVATYPGGATPNRYAETTKDKIVDLVVTLINHYNIEDSELDLFLENLKGQAETQAEDELRWDEAERRNDEIRGK